MDTIRFLLGKVFQIVFILFIMAGILWFVGTFYPEFRLSNLISVNTFSTDWLPAPKNYKGLLGSPQSGGTYGTEYIAGPAYNGYSNAPASGNQNTNVNNQVFTGNTSAYAEKSLYIRNLSVYEGGKVSYGLTFVGEARDTMFRNGIFPISIIDRTGKVWGTTQAINTGAWATPGWARFQATIPNQLPPNIDCALIFFSANQNVKVGLAVRCN
jgi:hypothetical protein